MTNQNSWYLHQDMLNSLEPDTLVADHPVLKKHDNKLMQEAIQVVLQYKIFNSVLGKQSKHNSTYL